MRAEAIPFMGISFVAASKLKVVRTILLLAAQPVTDNIVECLDRWPYAF